MSILVCGGAGYIGSHTVRELVSKGFEVVVYDSLEYGHKKALPSKAKFVGGDVGDTKKLVNVMKKYSVDCVVHFAGYIVVPESTTDPVKYYDNNVLKTVRLIDAMQKAGVKNIVFSSSAAVYGDAKKVPIPEDAPKDPTNAYGETKWVVERFLKHAEVAYGIRSVCLRYFNASGADPSGEFGEDHDPETHLIPIVLKRAVEGKEVSVFGVDYPTKDGSCVRDYIHVVDLASAHILAVNHLKKMGESKAYNVGTGNGFSVKQIIDAAKKITGIKIRVVEAARRPGDPPSLVADSSLIRKELGWKPKYSDVEEIIKHAWEWHKNNPEGYK
ncbi:UDP-glucose 4-epimerase GalE [Candidatus Woesearchaeota archaeon]|nr:UDP-glucose 4-epimerase GalE [Candidatus Woesearchaeota archaeon]